MDPLDFSTAKFKDLQERLQGLRLEVLSAWRQHGPGTTREVAQKSGIDILSFRPRSTELLQLGLLVLQDGSKAGHEGIYLALPEGEMWEMFWQRQQEARDPQLGLKL